MANNSEKFLEFVKDAERIKDTIQKLQDEIVSYNSAGQSLEQVRGDLEKYLKTAHTANVNMLKLTNTLSERMDYISDNADRISAIAEQGFLEVINRTSLLRTMIIIAVSISAISLVVSLFVN